ncbi:MAG TPA: hemolysin family protein [Candidatus Omnitrophota bacterium]|nr:hemolysin family protein [Candidatus Omnitrophota bacterium]HPT06729.1 hemolysin family protein [Candidatus Omnitrophota bacterium]
MAHFYLAAAILLPILLLLSFFFALSETSIIALNKLRLRHMLMQGVKRAKILERLVLKLDRVITAMLAGNNIVNASVSAIITTMLIFHFGPKWGTAIATVISASILLVLCEITPKILATKHTEKIALFTAPIMDFIVRAFWPLIGFFTGCSNFLLKIFGLEKSKRVALITEEELRLMIEIGKEEGVLSDEERKMLHRIFEFGDTKVVDIMVPKGKMVAVDVKTGFDDLLNIFVEEGHARLPVYRDSLDTVIGVIYSHDLLYILNEKELFVLDDLVYSIYRAQANMRVCELLKIFQTNKIQIAVVVDTKGTTLGLLTLEDLLEEIVGEIEENPVKDSPVQR